jgi:hypothetical protein
MTRIINRELIPQWGLRDPNEIQPEEIEAWTRGIAIGHRRAKAAPYLANRSFDYMAMIYSWAIRRRLLRSTPFVRLEKPFVEQRRSRTFTNDLSGGRGRHAGESFAPPMDHPPPHQSRRAVIRGRGHGSSDRPAPAGLGHFATEDCSL